MAVTEQDIIDNASQIAALINGAPQGQVEIGELPVKATVVAADIIHIQDSEDTDKDKQIAASLLLGGALGITFVLRGDAYAGVKQTQILMPAGATIVKVITYVDTAPTGASLIVDINKNGTTIFTTQSGRPEIAISGNTADSATPDITALAQDDRISVDIDQVGSTIPGGSDLLVTIVFA